MRQAMERQIGEKVQPKTGGYGGLNYHMLFEEGAYDSLSEIVGKRSDGRQPYLVRLPSGYTLWMGEKDLK